MRISFVYVAASFIEPERFGISFLEHWRMDIVRKVMVEIKLYPPYGIGFYT